MSTAQNVAQHAIHAAIGALALAVGDITGGTAMTASSLVSLGLIARKPKSTSAMQASKAAVEQAFAALQDSPEFQRADYTRATALLTELGEHRFKGQDLIDAMRKTDEAPLHDHLANELIKRIDFARDEDAKTRRVVELAIRTAVQTCAQNEAFKTELRTIGIVGLVSDVQTLKDDVAVLRTESRETRDDLEEIKAFLSRLNLSEETLRNYETTLIELARRIRPEVTDPAVALNELKRVVGLFLEMQTRNTLPSNTGDQVEAVFARMREQNEAGELDAAAETVNDALAELEAQKSRMLDGALKQDILRRNPASAARRLWDKLRLEVPDGPERFNALRMLWQEWYERGRDKGLNFDAEVAIHLAKQSQSIARTPDERGMTLNDLGIALSTLGERETGTDSLEKAVEAFQNALKELTRNRVPLDWATTQNNLGTALGTLGERETGTDSLEKAAAAFQNALKVYTRDHMPLQWATTQNNLGNVLQTLGARETGTDSLEKAVEAYHNALKERTRDRVPLDWAATNFNLALTYLAFFKKTGDATHLDGAENLARSAQEVYAQAGADHPFLTKCDNLLADIAAARPH